MDLFASGPQTLNTATGFQKRGTWVREEMEGNWYRTDDPPMEGWLCPALFKFFDAAPRELYVKAEAIRG